MHEMAIAMSLVEEACAQAEARHGERILALHVRVGALSGVSPHALAFAFPVAALGTAIEGVALAIEDVAVALLCPECRNESPPGVTTGLTCPRCGSSDARVVRGRELELRALEIVEV